MARAGLSIPRERWYSNLTTRGNTGAASIFIMLADFLRERELQPGQRILCFVPESGRFTVAFMMLEVVKSDARSAQDDATVAALPPPHDPRTRRAAPQLRTLLTELASIWHDYRSRAWRTPMIRKITTGQLHARRLRALDGVLDSAGARRQPVDAHRRGAPRRPPRRAGAARRASTPATSSSTTRSCSTTTVAPAATRRSIDALRRNPGGEALNAYMHALRAAAESGRLARCDLHHRRHRPADHSRAAAAAAQAARHAGAGVSLPARITARTMRATWRAG